MDFRLILLPFVADNTIRHIAGDQSELLERGLMPEFALTRTINLS